MIENEIWVDWYANYIKPDENANEPIFDVIYPVIETSGTPLISMTNEEKTSKNDDPRLETNTTYYQARGTVQTSVYWRNVISDILPPGRNGLVLVIENPCSPTFTYQIKYVDDCQLDEI
jgi:hypothetical protein